MLQDLVTKKPAVSGDELVAIIRHDLNGFSMAISAFEDALSLKVAVSNVALI